MLWESWVLKKKSNKITYSNTYIGSQMGVRDRLGVGVVFVTLLATDS